MLSNFDPRLHLGFSDWLGFSVWLVAILGESLADRQLAAFKADPSNRGKVCSAGLWKFSRHPNYFFEWLVWVALFLFALPAPWGWTTIFAPALMLFFLLRVTGIPYTEQQSLRSRGEAYRSYQRTTSAFVPWFPKR
jgi:steroid 5-alpha reductase family enzyme